MKTFIIVRGWFRGSHYWPDAAQIGYPQYAHLHFHYFGFTAEIEVAESREFEFHQMSNRIAEHLSIYLDRRPSLSCEDLAVHLTNWLWDENLHPRRVEVNEDGLCGAAVESDKEAEC